MLRSELLLAISNYKEKVFLIFVFCITFIILISKPAIISPDTYSYLNADIVRLPVYIIISRSFKFLFQNNYEIILVGFQLLFNFISIYTVFFSLKSLLNFKLWARLVIVILLIYPLYTESYGVNNICSESIAYPLYLLVISFTFDFLFKDQVNKIFYIAITLILLALTRGQFFFISVLITLIYILKHKNSIFRRKHLLPIVILILLPFLISVLESTSKKIVYGYYVKTPYSYVNAVTLPLYVSDIKDSLEIDDKHYKNIFIKSFNTIDSLNLLSSKVNGRSKEKYKVFHDNFPIICNQNIHNYGRKYYFDLEGVRFKNSIQTEMACKRIFFTLLKNNFKEWIKLYFVSIIHGFFGSLLLFLFFALTLIYSGLKLLNVFSISDAIVFLGSSLIISNAMIVALACHSISRYLFYNYFLGFIIIVLIMRRIYSKYAY